MARRSGFRILLAVDGSSQARAALATVVRAPWPESARVRAVAARQRRGAHQRSIILTALDRRADDAAQHARRTLARRWPDADALVVDSTAVGGILAEARRYGADVIAVGWRGYGPARRLLMGSVSRGVVRGAERAVLVVRRAPAQIRNIVLAIDGSPNARRAVRLVARLVPTRDSHVTLVQAVELLTPTSRGLMATGIRASISLGVKRINAERSDAARKALAAAEKELARAGWRTRTELKNGEPLREVMDAVSAAHADLVVVGARGASGARHLLLGSVAEGVLNRSPVPILLVR
ncbi:MAG TPA: universal stress protein [Vicinamibacterales bacterium]|nr:universal stress protein [Vicinamibacterales bacterium]